MLRTLGALGATTALAAVAVAAPAAVATPRNFEMSGVVDPGTVTPSGFTLKVNGGNGPALRVTLEKGRTLGILTDTNTQYLTRTGFALDLSSQDTFAATVAANANNKIDTRVRVFIRTPRPGKGKGFRGIDSNLVLATPAYRVVDITSAARTKGLVRYAYRGTCTGLTTSTISVRVDAGNWRGMRSVLRSAATDGSLNTIQTFAWNAETKFAQWIGGRLQDPATAQAALAAACTPGSSARVGVNIWSQPGKSVADLNASSKTPVPASIVSSSEPAEKG